MLREKQSPSRVITREGDNQSGFGLIVILVVMTIIAAIFFGSSYFSQKSQVETYVEVDRRAEEMIGEINMNTAERREEIEKLNL